MSNFTKLMAQAAAGAAGGGDFYPYTVDNSVRLDGSSCVQRTPSSTSSRTTWTFSAWVKPVYFSGYQFIFTAGDAGSNTTDFFYYNGTLQLADYSPSYNIISNAVFRDPSAWYHVVAVFDTTNATASDRYRMYVNGERITDFSASSLPPQNYAGGEVNNSAYQHRVGGYANFASYWLKGYMAEVHFVDGTALDASSFGENKNGIWIPKSPSVTYGTNGFYLDFGNSGALGTDVSGNGNNWTVNGLTSSDQMIDTPTNNFPTWNPLLSGLPSGTPTLSDGNLTALTTGAGSGHAYATMAIPESGDWYWEITWDTGSYLLAGIAQVDRSTVYIPLAKSIMYHSDGFFYQDATTSSGYTSASLGDVIGIRANVDAGTVSFYLNNTLLDTFTYDVKGMFPQVGDASGTPGVNTISATANFGQSSFTYTPPGTSIVLSTANLPEPTIGPNSATTSDEHFNNVVYTGTGATRSVTGVGFQPDFTWIKRRSASENHWLTDAVRGVTKGLFSNLTDAEATRTDQIQSFDSDGFTLGADGAGYTNISGNTYVGWNWKANGSGVSNTDGSITTNLSANADAGISIMTYTGNATAGATLGHGLGVAPKMALFKRKSTTGDWYVYHESLGVSSKLKLNTNDASSSSTDWNSTAPGSSVFTIGSGGGVNTSGASYVAYLFAEVEGFSKFGSWTGVSGSEFIYTGFRPAFVLVKRTNASGWFIFDNKRGYNGGIYGLSPNTSGAETGPWATQFSLYSNGFEDNNYVGDAGTTIIYMAFAENPFKYANAR